jgi:hypothetical protein
MFLIDCLISHSGAFILVYRLISHKIYVKVNDTIAGFKVTRVRPNHQNGFLNQALLDERVDGRQNLDLGEL